MKVMTNVLYKYFSTEEFKLKKFTEQKVLLTPPKYFNDPWDFLVRREPPSEEELRALFEKFENEEQSNGGSEEEKEKRFQTWRESVTNPKFEEGEGPHMQVSLSAKFGAVCLTSRPLDRLMWAHYAESYRGFVAEFKCPEELVVHGRLARQTPFGAAIKVLYDDTWPRAAKDFKNVWEVCSTKHTKWKDEDEWRVILELQDPRVVPDGNRYYLQFEPQDLRRVFYFENRVSQAIQDHLQKMLARGEFAHVEKEIVKIDPASGQLITQPSAK